MFLYRFLTRRFGLFGSLAYMGWRNRKQIQTIVTDLRARRANRRQGPAIETTARTVQARSDSNFAEGATGHRSKGRAA